MVTDETEQIELEDRSELRSECTWEARRETILRKHGLWSAYGEPENAPDLDQIEMDNHEEETNDD